MLIKLLALVVPLGLAGAVSPMLLTEQTVLMSRADGRRMGRAFALGAIAVLTAFIVVLVLFGRSIELPKTPHLDAQLDVVVGVLLIVVAFALRMRGRAERPERHKKGGRGTRGAFTFGCFSMATNFTTLALMVPAAKEVAASDLKIPGRAIAALVLIALASIPAWLPLALSAVAPGQTDRVLGALNNLSRRHGNQIGFALLTVVGVYFTIRGLVRLID